MHSRSSSKTRLSSRAQLMRDALRCRQSGSSASDSSRAFSPRRRLLARQSRALRPSSCLRLWRPQCAGRRNRRREDPHARNRRRAGQRQLSWPPANLIVANHRVQKLWKPFRGKTSSCAVCFSLYENDKRVARLVLDGNNLIEFAPASDSSRVAREVGPFGPCGDTQARRIGARARHRRCACLAPAGPAGLRSCRVCTRTLRRRAFPSIEPSFALTGTHRRGACIRAVDGLSAWPSWQARVPRRYTPAHC